MYIIHESGTFQVLMRPINVYKTITIKYEYVLCTLTINAASEIFTSSINCSELITISNFDRIVQFKTQRIDLGIIDSCLLGGRKCSQLVVK